MGAQPSKIKRSKDPKWQGIGPDTPIPSSAQLHTGNTSNNLSSRPGINTTTTTTTTTTNHRITQKPQTTSATPAAKEPPKKSKIKIFFKVDPKKGQKKITKNLISLPSDFRHTGHIGAGEVRSGRIDPDRIKSQMMEVAACLRLDLDTPMPVLKTIPVQCNEDREASSLLAGPPPVERYGMGPSAVAAH